MKSGYLFFIAFLLTGLAQAQSPIAQSSQPDDLPELMIFSGSDWCKPCILLKKEVIDTPEFQSFAEGRLHLHIVDFPYRKANQLPAAQQARNEELAERYNPHGHFPYLVLVDPQGKWINTLSSRSLESLKKELLANL